MNKIYYKARLRMSTIKIKQGRTVIVILDKVTQKMMQFCKGTNKLYLNTSLTDEEYLFYNFVSQQHTS